MAGEKDIEEQKRDSGESSNRETESNTRDNLSSQAFDQNSNTFKQSIDAMNQTLKRGSESALSQFGKLDIFDSASKTDSKDAADDGDDFKILSRPQSAAERSEKQKQEKEKLDKQAAERKDPEEGKPLDRNASEKGSINYLKNLPEIDYKNVLKDQKVTLIGEDHKDFSAKQHVADSAENMKAAGVTHFAMEMIPQEMQSSLDKFSNGDKGAREELKNYLMNTWDKSYPGTGEKYMQMLDSMKNAGIKVVGTDINKHTEKTEEDRKSRDRAWAGSIANILKEDPNAKVVAYGGADHFNKEASAHKWHDLTNDYLKKEHKIESQVLRLNGFPASKTEKHDEQLRDSPRSDLYRFGHYKNQAGREESSLFVPVANNSSYDGFIFAKTRK